MPGGSDEQMLSQSPSHQLKCWETHFLVSSHEHTSVTQQDFLFLPHEMRSTGTRVKQVKKQHVLSQPEVGQTEAALLKRHSVDTLNSQERLLHPSLTRENIPHTASELFRQVFW